MSSILLLLLIAIITSFSFIGAWYVRKNGKIDALIGIYVAFVLMSNIIAFKIVEFNLGFVKLYATAASIIFPVTFLLTDIVNEKFGKKETHRMIFIAFITQVIAAVFIILSLYLKPAPFFSNNEIFATVLGFAPRVMLASLVAFMISENADAYLFAWFRKITSEKHLWARNVFSGIPSMALDTVIFVTIAFYGVQPLLPLITGVLAIKWLVGVINIPFMYLNRKIMYRK